jgi:hypothetical protein
MAAAEKPASKFRFRLSGTFKKKFLTKFNEMVLILISIVDRQLSRKNTMSGFFNARLIKFYRAARVLSRLSSRPVIVLKSITGSVV